MALVLTLAALVLMTAVIMEFTYAVYTGTNSLYNWYNSKRLSVLAGSVMDIAADYIYVESEKSKYTYPRFFDMDLKTASSGFSADVSVRIEDENSKFNLNTIVYPNGILNEKAYNAFKRLLSRLSLDANIAGYVADWIDPDKEERAGDSEAGAKNSQLYSVDELLLIKNMDKATYEKLIPYVTVYGDGLININTAEKPVLLSLSEDISEELAQRIIDYRKLIPFEETSRLQKVAGFDDLSIYGPISAAITVRGKYFHVRSSASSGGIKSIIEAVIGTGKDIKYWREF